MRRVLEEEELDRLLPVVLPGAITEDELQAQAREQEEEEAARLAQDLSRCSDKVLRLRARISRRIGVVELCCRFSSLVIGHDAASLFRLRCMHSTAPRAWPAWRMRRLAPLVCALRPRRCTKRAWMKSGESARVSVRV